MTERAPTAVDQVRILSVVPGRVRVRVFGRRRAPEELERVAAALDGLSGVIAVQASRVTGSLLVHYDPGAAGIDELRGVLEGLGLAVVDQDPSQPPARTPARRVFEAADEINSGVGRRLGGPDLRLLFPVALGALSVRQARRDAPGLDQAPWYVLAWYAYDSFLKLNGRVASGSPGGPDVTNPIASPGAGRVEEEPGA